MSPKRIVVTLAVIGALLTGASSAMALVRGTQDAAATTTVPTVEPSPLAEEITVADTRKAEAVLKELQAKYRYLDGVTVSIAPTPAGEQAIAYYTNGEIVVNTERSATIRRILAHEIWHVIDWRDNGRLDWGENLPPAQASDYLK